MENGLLVSVSRQAVLQRQMDVIANNLANINTTGFRAERLMVAEDPMAPQPFAGRRGDGPTIFVHDLSTYTDAKEGRLETTGNSLDMAVRGDGFFVIQQDGEERYTRDGHFRRDDSGQLVTEAGDPVMGQNNQPIILPLEDGQVTVASDGTVSTDDGTVAGKLRVVRFDDPTQLTPLGGGLFNTDQPPTEVLRPTIEQGMLESSNVEPIIEMEQMIRVHRAYDSARALFDREDDRIHKMLQVYAA